MLELIRRLIKWIIIAILFIVLIIILIGLVKKTDSKKTVGTYKPTVQTIKSNENTNNNNSSYNNTNNSSNNNVEVYQNDNQAELPDTASSRDILLIITGIVITASGFYFIYKNKQCNNI